MKQGFHRRSVASVPDAPGRETVTVDRLAALRALASAARGVCQRLAQHGELTSADLDALDAGARRLAGSPRLALVAASVEVEREELVALWAIADGAATVRLQLGRAAAARSLLEQGQWLGRAAEGLIGMRAWLAVLPGVSDG